MSVINKVAASARYHISLLSQLVFVDDNGNTYQLGQSMRGTNGDFILLPVSFPEPVKAKKEEGAVPSAEDNVQSVEDNAQPAEGEA